MSLRGSADGDFFTMGARFSQSVPESLLEEGDPSFPEDAASLHRELSPPPRQLELLDHMEVCANAGDALIMEGNLRSMFVNGSMEESLLASHATQQDAHNPAHQGLGLAQTHPTRLGAHQAAAYTNNMNSPSHSKTMASFRGYVSPRSSQPVGFLDVCFLCSKRLGHGKDVFIYRGDRAYCSAECRNSQIVADERRERCGPTSAKERVGVNIPASDGPLLA